MRQPPSLADEARSTDTALSVPEVRHALRLALLIPALVIGALCALLAWQVAALSELNRWVAHTHEVIAETWRVQKLLIQALLRGAAGRGGAQGEKHSDVTGIP